MKDPKLSALKRQLQDLENQKLALEAQLRALLAKAPSSDPPSSEENIDRL
jgi:hypothetical protein